MQFFVLICSSRYSICRLLMIVHKNQLFNVLNKFNSYHKEILFKMEIEQYYKINILDITIYRRETLITNWFTKCIFAVIIWNFTSKVTLL